jgi:hypothetical protein
LLFFVVCGDVAIDASVPVAFERCCVVHVCEPVPAGTVTGPPAPVP